PEPGDFRRGGWVFSRLDVVRRPHEPVTCGRVVAAQGEVDVGVKLSEQAVAAAEEDRRDGNSDLVDELRGEEGLDGLPAVDVGALGTEAAEKRGRLLNVVGGLDAGIARGTRAQHDHGFTGEGPRIEARDGFVGAAAHDNRVDGRKEGLPFPGGMIRAGAGMGSWFRVGEPGEVAAGFGDEAVETHRDEYAAVPRAIVPHVGPPRSGRASGFIPYPAPPEEVDAITAP